MVMMFLMSRMETRNKLMYFQKGHTEIALICLIFK